ncbi:hypothetical protein PSTG_15582 [Puccinia striiformis f. sp. tritici PST-78]|uniref:Reverse transcriptase domain-containing protein n=1 Tax=Puccinia striiformis f. sp. tritici PST-78 TaxID=1165861 RepID=A0A0L0UW91_9BASI|nr:hypothetical protein PSTG_15582 [Puccinia striiformis f. sp. tritici PST-78]
MTTFCLPDSTHPSSEHRADPTELTVRSSQVPEGQSLETETPECWRVNTPNPLSPEWPDEVHCEMNIPEWQLALSKNGLLPEFDDVLHGFTHGFHQGIPNHHLGAEFPYYTPPNHKSALLAREKIEETIEKELPGKRMFGPYSKDEVLARFGFFRTSPLGATVNGDGSVRPTNDLSYPHEGLIPSVNSFVNKDDYQTTWDHFDKVSAFFHHQNQPLLLAIFDWENAYRQIPTAKSQWPYLMVQDFEDKILIDTRITFGGVAGCGSFGRPADAWKQIMQNEFDLVQVFCWVDDNLFIKTHELLLTLDHIVTRSDELGVKTNPSKISPFQEEQKYIGFVWNGAKRTVRLPSERKYERIQQLKAFLQPDEVFTYNQVEVLAGRLNHISSLLPQLRCYLNSIYRWLNDWYNRRHPLPTPPDAKEDIDSWFQTLLVFDETRIVRSPNPTEIGWVGDASTGFGLGILIGRKWAQFQLTKEWGDGPESDLDIGWLETVAIRLGLLILAKLGALPGKNFIVWTDNTTTENLIKKRKSKHTRANNEWKLIQAILVKMQIDIVSRRVTSSENAADALSRGDRPEDMVVIDLPHDLENRMFQSY